MNKEDIYKLIGYHGEYNEKVKKSIRKLLKENHPDNKGERKTFELINEVKKELERGKVSYYPKEKDGVLNSNFDIDYDYCYQKINEIKVKKTSLNKLLSQKRDMLLKYEKDYKELYQDSLDIESNLLINSSHVHKVKNIKALSIIFLIMIVIVFTFAVFKNSNVAFVIFVVLSLVCILIIHRYLLIMQHIQETNKKKFTSYVKMNNNLRKNIHKQSDLKKEIYEIKRKLNTIENDLRFYQNLLK